jgi:hypothetical protein
MICESLGYFTVKCAANALAFYKADQAYACEWYSDCCRRSGKGLFDEPTLIQVGKDVVLHATRRRNQHKGPMAEYQRAITLVEAELGCRGSTADTLAGWF